MPNNNRLNELNRECMKCIQRNGGEINRYMCSVYCPIGHEVHKLEDKAWNKVDWNSAKWAELYRH